MPNWISSRGCDPAPRPRCLRRRRGIRRGWSCGRSRFSAPSRVALLLAALQTPWRFRTKRHRWAPVGVAVVTRSSADYVLVDGQAVRRQRAPMRRGLNRNHHRVVKDVFKGAATAAPARPGALQDFPRALLARVASAPNSPA